MEKALEMENSLVILMKQNLVAARNSKPGQMRMLFLFYGNELAICYNIL